MEVGRPINKGLIGPLAKASLKMDQVSIAFRQRVCFPNSETTQDSTRGVEEGGRLSLCSSPIRVFLLSLAWLHDLLCG